LLIPEAQQGWVDGVAFLTKRAVGELQETARCDRRSAVQDKVAAGETGVDELVIVSGDARYEVEAQ